MDSASNGLHTPTDPLQPEQVFRLYSMIMCPYAQRARLIAAAKNINYDLVNVDLNRKPDWFFDYNPNGEVPLLIHNGKHVYESLITAEYIEEAFPNPKLVSDDPVTRAWERIYYNHWTKKGIPAFYSLLKQGYLHAEMAKRFDDNVMVMENFLKNLSKAYFHGDKVGFVDYMIWPWFERMQTLKDITDYTISEDKCPKISAWIELMWKDPVVQACTIDLALITKHYAKYRTGNPDFTIGVDQRKAIDEPLENLDALRDPSTRDRQK